MKKFITSSVEPSIKLAAKLAQDLNVGLEVSRLPGVGRIDTDFDGIIKDLKESVKDFHGEITLHALFSDLNPASRDEAIRKITLDRYEKSFIAAQNINATNVVFHSGSRCTKHKGSMQNFREGSIKFWTKFVKRFEDCGIVATLENILERDPFSIPEIVKAVNSPNLKLTLDTGHANICSDIDIVEWVNFYGKDLYHMHVHNNFGENDDHFGLNRGNIDFVKVLQAAYKNNPNVKIVFEIFDKRELLESVKTFDKILFV